jgi:hypothetical protein
MYSEGLNSLSVSCHTYLFISKRPFGVTVQVKVVRLLKPLESFPRDDMGTLLSLDYP